MLQKVRKFASRQNKNSQQTIENKQQQLLVKCIIKIEIGDCDHQKSPFVAEHLRKFNGFEGAIVNFNGYEETIKNVNVF